MLKITDLSTVTWLLQTFLLSFKREKIHVEMLKEEDDVQDEQRSFY